MGKRFVVKVVGRANVFEFGEGDIASLEDFADPEREEILELGVGQELKLSDGAVVKRQL